VPTEASIIKQARARERKYIDSIKAHPNAPRKFDDFVLYLEDNLLDLRELAKVRGLDFQHCAEKYIDDVVVAWRTTVSKSDTSAAQLRETLRQILEVL
jgi:hypothetical protein